LVVTSEAYLLKHQRQCFVLAEQWSCTGTKCCREFWTSRSTGDAQVSGNSATTSDWLFACDKSAGCL